MKQKIITNSYMCIAVVMCLILDVNVSTFQSLEVECPHCLLVDHCAHSQFNVLCGGTIECLVEPWHARVSTAGILYTITLLPIPQGIICV